LDRMMSQITDPLPCIDERSGEHCASLHDALLSKTGDNLTNSHS
jgi:hypothetical protein